MNILNILSEHIDNLNFSVVLYYAKKTTREIEKRVKLSTICVRFSIRKWTHVKFGAHVLSEKRSQTKLKQKIKTLLRKNEYNMYIYL